MYLNVVTVFFVISTISKGANIVTEIGCPVFFSSGWVFNCFSAILKGSIYFQSNKYSKANPQNSGKVNVDSKPLGQASMKKKHQEATS